MNFITKIKQSIYSATFYKAILNESTSKVFVYFLCLSLILSLIKVLLSIPSLLTFNKEIPGFVSNVVNLYPNELEVTIKNGLVSTNVSEPYFITAPNGDGRSKLLVIDTVTPFSLKQFNDYGTVAWVTKDAIFFKSDEKNDIKGYNLTNVQDLTINKKSTEELINKFLPFLAFFVPLIFVLIFIGMFLLYMFRLVYLLFVGLIVFLIAKFSSWNFSYGQSYRVAIYASTVGFILELVLSFLGQFTGLYGFPFMLTLSTIIVVLINYSGFKRENVSKKKH